LSSCAAFDGRQDRRSKIEAKPRERFAAFGGERLFLRNAYFMGRTLPYGSALFPGSAAGRAFLIGLSLPAGTETIMTDSDAVLAANLEFYRAFGARDLAAMDALWARNAPVACIHPGWPALADRDAIIESWRGILSSPESPRIVCYDERVFLYGDTALVVCEEELGGGTLVASNLFVREAEGWRIAHHQAGQLVARRTQRPPPSRLN
jgi:ketosteroid isomerase-like protein